MTCKRGSLVSGSDKLPARCVGPWSRDKVFYIDGYLRFFSNAMRNKFPVRHYLDLFAGPGRCIPDDGLGEFNGSPLTALELPHRFTQYHFVEKDPVAMDALKARVCDLGADSITRFYPGDANALIDDLTKAVPVASCNVAVIDPTGLDLTFNSLKSLTENRRMDLIYLFPEGMSVKRNLSRFLAQSNSRLDLILGSREWRSRVERKLLKADEAAPLQYYDSVTYSILEIFRKQLQTLGYSDVRLGSEVLVRNKKNVPLYYLVFASKNPLGQRFWNLVRKSDPIGQGQLDLL